MKLEFFVIGAQKCATSWLHACLAQHPGISLPAHKREIHYLGGAEHRRRGDDWFLARYARGGAIRGDVSVEYLEDPASAQYLRARFPEGRLVVSLRDPVDRAISAYYWALRNGLVSGRSLDTALEAALAAGPEGGGPDFLRRGLYGVRLRRYQQAFGADRLFALCFEHLAVDAAGSLAALFSFLGVDPEFVPPAFGSRPKRSSHAPALVAIERRLGRARALRKLADLAHQALGRAGLTGTRPAPGPALRQRLIGFYAADLERLRDIVGEIPPGQRPGFDRLEALWPTLGGAAGRGR
ncbi:MAG TPA: sulfotransferase [Steroidobacteraceae bacterium]|jgi:hypothetical protein